MERGRLRLKHTSSLITAEATELDFTKVLSRAAKITLTKAAKAHVGHVEELDVHLSDVTFVFYEGEPSIKKDVKRPAALVKRE